MTSKVVVLAQEAPWESRVCQLCWEHSWPLDMRISDHTFWELRSMAFLTMALGLLCCAGFGVMCDNPREPPILAGMGPCDPQTPPLLPNPSGMGMVHLKANLKKIYL